MDLLIALYQKTNMTELVKQIQCCSVLPGEVGSLLKVMSMKLTRGTAKDDSSQHTQSSRKSRSLTESLSQVCTSTSERVKRQQETRNNEVAPLLQPRPLQVALPHDLFPATALQTPPTVAAAAQL